MTETAIPATHETLIDSFWTEQDVARQLKISTRTLLRLRALRRGPPPIRIGKRIYYARDSVLAWLKALEEPHTTPSRRGRSLSG